MRKNNVYFQEKQDHTEALTALCGRWILLGLWIYCFWQGVRRHQSYTARKELLQQEIAYCQDVYKKMEQKRRWIQKVCHDMRNLYVLEMGYLEGGQYGRLMQHYKKMLGEMQEQEKLVYTGNIGIDSILNYQAERGRQDGICLEIKALIPGAVTIEHKDMNRILGNLLDNAIEAVRLLAVDQRKIWVEMKSDGSGLLVQVVNPYAGKIQRDKKGDYLTGKVQRHGHGIGLKAVRETVKKYQGIMEVMEKRGNFFVRIFLPMRAK